MTTTKETIMDLLTRFAGWARAVIARMTTDRVIHFGKLPTTILPETGARAVARALGYKPPIKPASPAHPLDLTLGDADHPGELDAVEGLADALHVNDQEN
jgi:hypothetical protein